MTGHDRRQPRRQCPPLNHLPHLDSIETRYGNRNITATLGGVNGYNPSYTASNNRIVGLTYDAVGNITHDGTRAMSYDANNKLVSATIGGSTSTYQYNANSSRIAKTVSGTTTWYIYGLEGELVAEYPAYGAANMPQTEYDYRNGELLIEGGCDAVRWRVTDHLGSTRMVVDLSGSLTAMKRHDYLPFGEEIGAGAGIRTAGQGYPPPDDKVKQKFTGKEREGETGLDYSINRYYSPIQGRFTSADVPFYDQYESDPQSWNLYSYVRNNPLRFTDPQGLACKDANGNPVGCSDGEAMTAWSVEYDKDGKSKRVSQTQYWNAKGGFWETGKEYNARLARMYPTEGQFAIGVGVFAVAGVAGGTGVGVVLYTGGVTVGGSITVLNIGARVGPGVAALNQLSKTDQRVFQVAGELGMSATKSFNANLDIFGEAVRKVIPTGQINPLGFINGSQIWGSTVSRIGLAEVNGTTVVVKAALGADPQILGKLPY